MDFNVDTFVDKYWKYNFEYDYIINNVDTDYDDDSDIDTADDNTYYYNDNHYEYQE